MRRHDQGHASSVAPPRRSVEGIDDAGQFLRAPTTGAAGRGCGTSCWTAPASGVRAAIAIACAAPEAEDAFKAMIGDLLRPAQEAGTARRDIEMRDLKAILVGCQAMQAYDSTLAERATDAVIDGLRAVASVASER
ncbi:hypothetical protein [Mycobacterium servetii]